MNSQYTTRRIKNFIRKPGFALCFFLFLICCSEDSPVTFTEYEAMAYRQAAYNFLSSEEKESIVSDWQTAPVNRASFYEGENSESRILLEGNESPVPYISVLSPTFENGTPLVTVTFYTSNDSLLGPIVVILTEDEVPVGFLPRL